MWFPDSLWILGLDPGETTGAALIAVTDGSLLHNSAPAILAHHTWDITGPLVQQVSEACHIAASVCPARADNAPLIVAEDYDMGGNRLTGRASTADIAIPIRWGGALEYAVARGHADRSLLRFQDRTLAFSTATDERLRAWGLYVKGDHKRDATRHAITMIRRIRNGSVSAGTIWKYTRPQ